MDHNLRRLQPRKKPLDVSGIIAKADQSRTPHPAPPRQKTKSRSGWTWKDGEDPYHDTAS